jgi:hypothetical protein
MGITPADAIGATSSSYCRPLSAPERGPGGEVDPVQAIVNWGNRA